MKRKVKNIMLFEKTLEEKQVTKPNNKTQVRIDLEPEREYKLKRIMKAYNLKVKKISRTKLIKMAIDNLTNDLEGLSEEEAVEYIRTLYKEAEF